MPLRVKEELKKATTHQLTLEELIDSLKQVEEDIGQICESTSEEKRLVETFFKSFLSILQPLATTLPVSTAHLPQELGRLIQANVDPTGHLILVNEDREVKLIDLSKESERDLMICVMKDVMPKFKRLTSLQKEEIENRIEFLSSVTKELQKISKAFSTATTE